MSGGASGGASKAELEQVYSRQQLSMGAATQAAVSKTTVLVVGVNGLGLEIAKNLILTGFGGCLVSDDSPVSYHDLSAQYYLSEAHVGAAGVTRASACIQKLADLSPLGQSRIAVAESKQIPTLIAKRDVQVVVSASGTQSEVVQLNALCRAAKVSFVAAHTFGLAGAIFADKGAAPHSDFDSLTRNGASPIPPGPPVFGRYMAALPAFIQFALYRAVLAHQHTSGALPNPDKASAGKLLAVVKQTLDGKEQPLNDFKRWLNADAKNTAAFEDYVQRLAFSAGAVLAPMCAVVGGIVSQEVIKLAAELRSLSQFQFFAAPDCLPPFAKLKDLTAARDIKHRYAAEASVFGPEFVKALNDQRVFVVGAGAIGCELLKLVAATGVGAGAKGMVTVTDMDNIEISNLSRQFLFRRADISKAKSSTAAAAAKVMNPSLKITAYTEGLKAAASEDGGILNWRGTFDRKFFESQSAVLMALDNRDARRYVDARCYLTRRPALDSGTIGPQGSTKVIYPFVSSRYASLPEPQAKEAIPQCTLKTFPYKPEHNIQWAVSVCFGDNFDFPLDTCNNFLKSPTTFFDNISDKGMVLTALKNTLGGAAQRSFKECVEWAYKLFVTTYTDKIAAVLVEFPPGSRDKDGALNWAPPRLMPKPLHFDIKVPAHLDFVVAGALLRAQCFAIAEPKDCSDAEWNTKSPDAKRAVAVAAVEKLLTPLIAGSAVDVKSGPAPPTTTKTGPTAQATAAAAKAAAEAMAAAGDKEAVDPSVAEAKAFVDNWLKSSGGGAGGGDSKSAPSGGDAIKYYAIKFDKDEYVHGDFLTAATNLRSMAYGIKTATRLEAMQVAGSIIPALVTTTATVAGLAMIEFYKFVQIECKSYASTEKPFVDTQFHLEHNSLLLAHPPLPTKPFDWPFIEVDAKATIKQVVDRFKNEYKLEILGFSDAVGNRLYASYDFSGLISNKEDDVLSKLCAVKTPKATYYFVHAESEDGVVDPPIMVRSE